jgi:hypothetical protein
MVPLGEAWIGEDGILQELPLGFAGISPHLGCYSSISIKLANAAKITNLAFHPWNVAGVEYREADE